MLGEECGGDPSSELVRGFTKPLGVATTVKFELDSESTRARLLITKVSCFNGAMVLIREIRFSPDMREIPVWADTMKGARAMVTSQKSGGGRRCGIWR